MSEVQKHGFSFEKWVRDTFFESYEGVYSQKWDVPTEHNKSKLVPAEFRGLPVSIKTTKQGSPVNLGDALRQFEISEEFVMICGIWRQANRQEKHLVAIGAAKFSASAWRELWAPLKLSEIKGLDRTVKDRSISYSEARIRARSGKPTTLRAAMPACALIRRSTPRNNVASNARYPSPATVRQPTW